jgi:hypothetical protein
MPSICQICHVIRRKDIFHCPDCNVCIEGYDHHCPWIGKCVGSNNLRSFYFFLLMLFGNMILCLIAIICMGTLNTPKNNTGEPIAEG